VSPTPGAERPVRWGILSTAGINGALIPALRESAYAELVAVASRDQERAREYAKEHGIERAFGSYEALLADDEIDAVYLPLPNSLHVEWSIKALDAGKHVLCEKPLDLSPAEVERAFDAAERNARLLMEAFMWRHHVDTIAMQELVAGGEIGEVRHVRAAFSFTLPAGDNIRRRPELQGGALMDVVCYPISAVRLFAGEPEAVRARQVVGPTGVDLRIAAMLDFAGDVTAFVDGAFDLPGRSVVEVVGSERVLVATWPFAPRVQPTIELRAGGEVEARPVSSDNRYRRQVDNFSQSIRGEATPLLGRDDAVGQARVLTAIAESARAGGTVVQV